MLLTNVYLHAFIRVEDGQDTGGDAKVDVDEFVKYYQDSKSDLSDEKIRARFKDVDVDQVSCCTTTSISTTTLVALPRASILLLMLVVTRMGMSIRFAYLLGS